MILPSNSDTTIGTLRIDSDSSNQITLGTRFVYDTPGGSVIFSKESESVNETITLYRASIVNPVNRGITDVGLLFAADRDKAIIELAKRGLLSDMPDDSEIVLEKVKTFDLPDKES